MVGRSARTLCLVVAVWAVLFAPGAFRGDSAAADSGRDLDGLGAAVIAPTFSTDGLHVARPCRAGETQVDVCDVAAGVVPGAVAVVLAAGFSMSIGRREQPAVFVRWHRATPPRAPPAV